MAPACKRFEEDLVLFYYGDLTGNDRVQVETHVRDCQSCALYLKELDTILPMTAQPDEPQPAFWHEYSREVRRKLDAIDERKSWWRKLAAFFQPWTVPALATSAVVALALTLTFGKAIWRDDEAPRDEVMMEVLPMAENLEFFRTMDVLDAMDFLEYLGGDA
ncbi:MAG: anti-sigma factor family protein [Candidatus Binatia bacterium]